MGGNLVMEIENILEKSWHHGKRCILSWKSYGKVMEFYYQISVGTLKLLYLAIFQDLPRLLLPSTMPCNNTLEMMLCLYSLETCP